jgi:hypothetical protein
MMNLRRKQLMNPMMIVALVVGGLALIGVWVTGAWTPGDIQTAEQPAAIPVTAAAATTTQEESDVETIEIILDNFLFEGPEGISGPQGQSGAFDEPSVVLRLKNGVPVRLVFKNVSPVVTHQVVSPIFGMPEEDVIVLQPLQEITIDYTPDFLDVRDGETLRFNLTCHERHGQATGHYGLGMRAIIEIVP